MTDKDKVRGAGKDASSTSITVYVTVDSDLQESNIIQINNVEKMASIDELL